MMSISHSSPARAARMPIPMTGAMPTVRMSKSRTKQAIAVLTLAWPGTQEVIERLTDYLTDAVPAPNGDQSLLQRAIHRCGVVFSAGLQSEPMTSGLIRASLGALLDSCGDVVHWSVSQGDCAWSPVSGVPLGRILDPAVGVQVHPCRPPLVRRDDAIAVIGQFALTGAERRALGDAQRLVREYRAVWPEA